MTPTEYDQRDPRLLTHDILERLKDKHGKLMRREIKRLEWDAYFPAEIMSELEGLLAILCEESER